MGFSFPVNLRSADAPPEEVMLDPTVFEETAMLMFPWSRPVFEKAPATHPGSGEAI